MSYDWQASEDCREDYYQCGGAAEAPYGHHWESRVCSHCDGNGERYERVRCSACGGSGEVRESVPDDDESDGDCSDPGDIGDHDSDEEDQP